MKNHSAYRRLREAKGFTLMEILVVMVIIVVLATLTISIYTWLETRKNEQATESIVRKIEMGLESYHSDHDRYPYGTEAPFNNHGVAWPTGRNTVPTWFTWLCSATIRMRVFLPGIQPFTMMS
nr:prepilin-type N-terminal cleavage/methylation domain-containing protein [Akkermansia muciniphila]